MNSHLDFLFWGICGDSQGEALSRQKNLEIRRDVRWEGGMCAGLSSGELAECRRGRGER